LLIEYKNRRIEMVCTDAYEAEKKHGKAMAEKLQHRVDQIVAAISVEMMIQYRIGRCHQLTGNRKRQYAVDLIHPYRLVFEKKGTEVQIAYIMEIVDYHK
jgi:proteic killer suppression protein